MASPRIPGPDARFLNLSGEKETIRYDGEECLVHIEPKLDSERLRKRQVTHPATGEPMWKDAPKGMLPKPMMELVEILPLYVAEGTPGSFEDPKNPGHFINPEAWREYVVDQGPNGCNTKNFHFRPDPKVAERIALEQRNKAALQRLLDRLAAGESEDAIVAEVQKRGPGRPKKNPDPA